MRSAAGRRVVLAIAALIALAACSGGDDHAAPSATVGTQPPQTTTTDPYAVPPVIDVAYVNRVLAGLDAATGEIVRIVVSTRSIPPEVIERLKAIYADKDLLQLQIDLFQDELRNGLKGYRPEPGNKRTTVDELISTNKQCVYAKVSRDYSTVSVAPDPRFGTQWVAIVPLREARREYNATGWAFTYDGFERGFTAPPRDPCTRA